VRYDPTVQVAHREPSSWSGLLRRRYRYGTSVVPLTRRHPGATSPLVLQPWSALTVLALLARRPLCAAATCATGTGLIVRRLRTTGLGWRQLTWPMASSLWPTFLGLGRWCGQFASPVLVLLLVRPGARGRTRRRRRVALGMLLLCPGLSEWARRRPKLDPFRFGLGVLADEAAYGAGVWRQCLRDRLWSPLVPSTARTASGLTAQNKSDYHSSCAG
ncbi:MAG TPA: hypothetical protein VK217_00375, partial [Acidimicrobiales bacterium]|nr:hypothetical protein [Acidimicrobiales bacterium]